MKKSWLGRKQNILTACSTSFLLACQLLVVPATAQAAEAHPVKVGLPSFPVQINGLTIDPYKAKYPPIIYKDITYFPVTWDYTRTLGLSHTWSESDGLRITSRGMAQVRPAADTQGNNRKTAYTAVPVTYPVFVNGKRIENESAAYPLLNFRDITYFPMTWQFMHDELWMNVFWNPEDGFAVVSPQRHYLSTILNDDADYLYINSGVQMLKIKKSLAERPAILTNDDKAKLTSLPQRTSAEVLPAAQFEAPDSPLTERKDKAYYYKGEELFSLTPNDGYSSLPFTEGAATDKEYTETWLDLGSARKIMSLREMDKNNIIPREFFTHYRYFFVDGSSRPVPVDGFTRWPISRVQANPNGTWWLTSTPLTVDDITARNSFMIGELSLLQPSGESVLVNRQLNAREIEVLSHKEDGTLIFRAYTRATERDNPGFGIYEIDTKGKITRLSDLYGSAYVSTDGDLWVTDRYTNRIMNVTKNLSKLWYDYEFPFADQG
ncbi:hypothetical protein [Paenibacillus xerothermodurans]|uniref:DUF5050 domain-containing protein n=1 Tax=Paenibacillus xerothermodurans TaxID=1977292 RepID=A0A2W1N9Q1_PAEXE|nr:hypothetical protein [Paenibacillus xerothermodurans]PZE19891.1 hypothetical protein CBW46_016345 [Paenibacillus xerothermodurans]